MRANDDHKPSWLNDLITDTSSPLRIGGLIVFGFIVVVGLWGALVPISGAVIASGQITVAAQNQLVQHPVGGVVAKIHVTDGQTVSVGDPILSLDSSKSLSRRDMLQARKAYQSALLTRLQKEYDLFENGGLIGSAALRSGHRQNGGAGSRTILDAGDFASDQYIRMKSSLDRIANEISGLRKQRQALRQERGAREAEAFSVAQQVKISKSEVSRMRPVVKQGYIAKTRFYEAQRREVDAVGRRAILAEQIDSLSSRLDEVDAKIRERKAAYLERIGDEMSRARVALREAASELLAAQHELDQTEIRAPATGRLVKLAVYTEGGVIKSNESVAEIIPKSSDIIAEGRLAPGDIENVAIGRTAWVTISALKSSEGENLEATVAYVSPDALTDEKDNTTYYLVRVNIVPSDKAKRLMAQIKYGMPADIFVRTNTRTFFSYLLRPISDSFNRAFREY